MGKRMDTRDDVNQSRRRDLDQKIELRMQEEMSTLYKDDDQARHTMSAAGRRVAMLAVILAVLLLLVLILVPYGALVGFTSDFHVPYFTYSVAEYREFVVYRVSSLLEYITTGGSASMGAVICSVVVVIAAGYAMSVTGAVYQGLFQNPMASPTTMGVNAGGTLGGIVYVLFFYSSTSVAATFISGDQVYTATTADEIIENYYSMNIFQRSAESLCILAGCFLGVAIILAISVAAGRGKISTVALMLAVSVFSTVINEIGQLVQYYLSVYGDEESAAAVGTLIGGNYLGSTFAWSELLLLGIPIGTISIIVFALSGRINIIAFGETEARAMGINITRYRNGLILACTVLSAVVMAFCGQVNMVGFLMPHLARYLVGPDFKKLVPASALMGGICTLLVYALCYLMGNVTGFNMYTGIVCTILSGVFIVLYRRNRHADWS